MKFEFATAAQIVFGAGRLQEIGGIVADFGTRAFVITGSTPERAAQVLKILQEKRIEYVTFAITGEPTIEVVQQGVQQAREHLCDVVIGFGGGSVMDTGKAVAGLLTNGGEPLDYLEVIGKGHKITTAAAPYIAIPTTAGPGTEVTRNAVIKSAQHQVKVSMRSPFLLPRVALIDPELTYTLPPGVTASTGLDAFTQVVEPYVSNKANPLTDALCREGMQRAARSLRRAYEYGEDPAAREDMSVVSLFGGLALANAQLGAVHGFAGPLGGMFSAPHGAICARVLPYVIEVNVRALQARQPGSMALQRYDEIARMLTGNSGSTAGDAVTWVRELCDALQVPALAQYGMTAADIPVVVEKSAKASSMKGNPLVLTTEELTEILERAL